MTAKRRSARLPMRGSPSVATIATCLMVVGGCASRRPGSSDGLSTDNGADGGSSGPSSDDGGSAAPPDAGTGRGEDAGGHDAGHDAGGTPGAGPPRDAGSCPAPPAGVDAQGAAALQLINQTRSAMGSACATMVATLNTSAAKHCAYFAANFAMNPSFTANMCIASPHYEVMGNGASAVQDWINSVYHRTDVLSPWTGDVGYGSALMCDTLDFGIGHTGASTSLIATYPYDGQTGAFDGGREEPTPAVPPSGWPSGYPVTVYIQGATLTTHELSVYGGAQIGHQWLTPQSDTNLKYANSAVLYGNAPLTHATRYLVHVAGTRNGSPVDVKFAFTTQ